MFNFDGEFYVMADELARLMDELRRREFEASLTRLERRAVSVGMAFSRMSVAAGEATRVMASLSRLFPMWNVENAEK